MTRSNRARVTGPPRVTSRRVESGCFLCHAGRVGSLCLPVPGSEKRGARSAVACVLFATRSCSLINVGGVGLGLDLSCRALAVWGCEWMIQYVHQGSWCKIMGGMMLGDIAACCLQHLQVRPQCHCVHGSERQTDFRGWTGRRCRRCAARACASRLSRARIAHLAVPF